MGKAKPVILDSRSFATQGLALKFFSDMLNKYIPGEVVCEQDAVHLASVFKRHPDYATKSLGGIHHFEVIPADYGSQCFCVVRLDGSKEDFSYKKCVTQSEK